MINLIFRTDMQYEGATMRIMSHYKINILVKRQQDCSTAEGCFIECSSVKDVVPMVSWFAWSLMLQ